MKSKQNYKLFLFTTSFFALNINISNAVNFNDKLYGKMNAKVLVYGDFYSGDLQKVIKASNDNKDKQSININGGIGFDLFYKANEVIHPFAGIDVNGGYTLLGNVAQDINFNQFFNANLRLGTSFKVNKSLRINPYGFVGLNVSNFKEGKGSGSSSSISEGLGYVYQNWLVELKDITIYDLKGDLTTASFTYVGGNIFTEKVQAYTNKTTLSSNGTTNINTVDNIAEIKNKVKNYNEKLLFRKDDEFIYYDILSLNDKMSEKYKQDFDGFEEEYKKMAKEGVQVLGGGNGHGPKTNIGLNAGAGIDFVIKERFIVGVEYKYSQVNFNDYNLKVQTHNIGLKLGVQFL